MLSDLGAGHAPEACSAASLAFELRAKARDEDVDPVVREFFPYVLSGDAELHGETADCYRALAAHEPRFAATAETHALSAVASRDTSFVRSLAFDHIGLAQIRVLQDEPEQACADGRTALAIASQVSSPRVLSRLRELHRDLTPHTDQPDVRDFRDELHQAVVAA
jgi:hypothetical protein